MSISFDILSESQVTLAIYEVESEQSFFTYKLFDLAPYDKLLPTYNDQLVKVISKHYLKVFSSLWSSPSDEIQTVNNYLITHYLNNNFNYTSVHKRSMEGGCSSILGSSTKPSDFSPLELPMNNAEWSGNLHKVHPLCEMTASFINDTITMHNVQHNPLFISFDGRGDVKQLKSMGAVFSSVINAKYPVVEKKFLDLYVAINGHFFILNPRSTFSWQAYVIRCCLGLESVPILVNADLYAQGGKEFEKQQKLGLWVSWVSILDAAKDVRNSLQISRRGM